MKKIILIVLVLSTVLFTTKANSQTYDYTVHEVGNAVGVSFGTLGWSFNLICIDTFYTAITLTPNYTTDFYLYWFNDLNPFTATSLQTIPAMANYSDLEFSLKFTDLHDLVDSVFLYTSSNSFNWTLIDSWAAINSSVDVSTTYSNTNDTYVKVELEGIVPSAGWHYVFSDFSIKADTTGITVGIDENIKNDYQVFSHENKISIKSTDNLEYAVVIYSLNGTMVYNQKAHGDTEIELAEPHGIYLVRLMNSESVLTKKVLLD
jgi:hypothetical protein